VTVISTNRPGSADELAAEMDRRGNVIEALEAENARLKQALAMHGPGGLRLIYDVRSALGWNDKTSLELLPGGVKELRNALADIRGYFVKKISDCEEMQARNDLTKDWGEAVHNSARLALKEIDWQLSIHRIDGIK
jgi:hypothetical protein